ncbi:hypothetical protein [Sinomicrobium oceani]|uniref:hypothetical protein n=1 Tax=Sinomicrobium oceani TaxID=1150368 RepID=UPI00227D06D5|nr:hypothetical protein [Sinomicrobium oceani]
MKKAILASALVFGIFAAQATPVIAHNNNIVTVQQEEFTEVPVDQVPQEVSDALSRDFEGATISKAYTNEAKEYKLEISMNGEENVLFADKDGNWIQK